MAKRKERKKKSSSCDYSDIETISSNYGQKNNERGKKALRSKLVSSKSRIKAKYSKIKKRKRYAKQFKLGKKTSQNTISDFDSVSQQPTKIILSQELVDQLSFNVTKSLMMLDNNRENNALKTQYKRKNKIKQVLSKIKKKNRRKSRRYSKYSFEEIGFNSSNLKELSLEDKDTFNFNEKALKLARIGKMERFSQSDEKSLLLENNLENKAKIKDPFKIEIAAKVHSSSSKIKSFSRSQIKSRVTLKSKLVERKSIKSEPEEVVVLGDESEEIQLKMEENSIGKQEKKNYLTAGPIETPVESMGDKVLKLEIEKLKSDLSKDLDLKNFANSDQKAKLTSQFQIQLAIAEKVKVPDSELFKMSNFDSAVISTGKLVLKSNATNEVKISNDLIKKVNCIAKVASFKQPSKCAMQAENTGKQASLSKQKTPNEKILAFEANVNLTGKGLALLKFKEENETKMIKQKEKESHIDNEIKGMAFQKKPISENIVEDNPESTLKKSTQQLLMPRTKPDFGSKILTSARKNYNSNTSTIEKTKKVEKVALKNLKILTEKLQSKLSKIELQSANVKHLMDAKNSAALSGEAEKIKSARKSIISGAIFKNLDNLDSIKFAIKVNKTKPAEQWSKSQSANIVVCVKNEKFIDLIKREKKDLEVINSKLKKPNDVKNQRVVNNRISECSIQDELDGSTIQSNITSFEKDIKTILTDVKEKKEFSKKIIPRISEGALLQNIKVNTVNSEAIVKLDHPLLNDYLMDYDNKMSLTQQMAQLKKMAFQVCNEGFLNAGLSPKAKQISDKIIKQEFKDELKQIEIEEKQSLYSFRTTSHEKIVHYNKLIKVPQVFSSDEYNQKENIKVKSKPTLLVKESVQPSNFEKGWIGKEIIQQSKKHTLVQEKNLPTKLKTEKRKQLNKPKEVRSVIKQIKEEIINTTKEQSGKQKDQSVNIKKIEKSKVKSVEIE